MSNPFWFVLPLFILLLSMPGCSGKTTQDADRQVLCAGNGAEPQDLDPQTTTGVPEHRIASALFEGLALLDLETLDPIPGTAESWSVSDDGLVYTFTIRDNARWSNGDPVTAHDFAYAWQRILSPALASEYAYMLHCIKNAKPFNEGILDDFGQVGVKALDDHTLEVRLEAPTPYFLSMQIHNSWYPVHRPTIERFGKMDQRGTKWTRPGNHVGNGAFMLERWDPNEVITVAKNPYYWGAADVKLDAVSFYPIENLQTEERNFRAGKLHLAETVPLSKIHVYQRDYPDSIRIDPYLGTYYYRFNLTRPPFDNVLVRRAFAMAIDKKTLVDNVLKGGQQPAGHFTPPNTAGYTCAATIPYDVPQARSLLAEAGYPNGQGIPPVELIYNTSENHKLIAEAVQQMWKVNLNVDVSLLNQDWKVYLDAMNNLDYGMARSGWIGDYVDPHNFLECFLTDGGNNRTGYASPQYDALIAKAAHTRDKQDRFAVYQQAEQLLLEDCPIAPIYFYTRIYLKAPHVKGWQSNILGHIPFRQLYFEPQRASSAPGES